MKRAVTASLVAGAFALAAFAGCNSSSLKKKGYADKCGRNLDCAYGLECAPGIPALAAADGGAPVDGGVASADAGAGAGQAPTAVAAIPAEADGGLQQAVKSCQWKTFGDCDGEGVTATGERQCLSGQKCRDNKCTVQCAAPGDCKAGEVCKVGACQKGAGSRAQCYDNRDCVWPDTCFYGQCVTRTETLRCQTDLDCGVGYRCINSRCQ